MKVWVAFRPRQCDSNGWGLNQILGVYRRKADAKRDLYYVGDRDKWLLLKYEVKAFPATQKGLPR